jgi:hypothetical protein
MIALLTLLLNFATAAFGWTKDSLPVFKGDITSVSHRTIEAGDGYIIIEIDGELYIYKSEN